MSPEAILSFLQVQVNLIPQDRCLLKIPDFEIPKASITGILGPSGEGKSTLLGLISGILDPSVFQCSGKIVACSNDQCTDLLALRPEQHVRHNASFLGYIPQEPSVALNPIRKIGSQITDHKTPMEPSVRKQAIDLLKKMDVKTPERLLNSYPHQVSGGQLQRCLIASAIIRKVPLIIADEPTSALDAITTEQVAHILDWINRDFHKTLLIVSHDEPFLQRICHKIMVLNKGTLSNVPLTSDLEPAASADEAISRMGKRIFKIQNVHFRYPNTNKKKSDDPPPAIHDLSFEIFENQVLGIVGPSGCGKSTLAKLLTGLIPFQEGQVNFNGHPFFELNRRKRAKVCQIVFQDPYDSFNPRMTLRQALIEVIRIYHQSEIDKFLKTLLNRVNLEPELLDRYPEELSGGQRQRFAILRSLAVDPKVLICDEITSNLDYDTAQWVVSDLNNLVRASELSVIMISHDLRIIGQIADHILIMQNGTIVEKGETQSVLSDPKHPLTKALLKAARADL